MIEFYSENDFIISSDDKVRKWIESVIRAEGFELGDISYVFCDDDYLLRINREFLDHDTLTDIISFDYSIGKELAGEIYISVERIAENAEDMGIPFDDELHRVMVHGVLHFCGYKDDTDVAKAEMRMLEDRCLKLRNFI